MKDRKFLYRDEWEKVVGKSVPDEVPALRKFTTAQVIEKDVDPNTGMADLEFVISTPAIDREHDIIEIGGWELANFQKNPVVLWAHSYREPPIAKATEVWIDGDTLRGLTRFTPEDMNPFGYMVYRMVKGGFMKATSVGFQPTQWVWNDEHNGYDFKEQDLLEYSVVPVPANPEALLAASVEGINLDPLQEWAVRCLDNDPSSDRVALWLPRALAEQIHKDLSRVTSTHIETGTGEDVEETVEIPVEAPPACDPPDLSVVAGIFARVASETTNEEEANVKEAIQALTEVVKELRASVDKLTLQAEASKETEPPVDPDVEGKEATDADDDLDEEQVRAVVKEVIEQRNTATTGKLPG